MSRKIFLGPTDTYAGAHPLLAEGVVNQFSTILPGAPVNVNDIDGTIQTGFYAGGSEQNQPFIAIEKGAHVGATVDTPWEAGETIQYVKVRSGERVAVRAALGTFIGKNQPLTIDNGQVRTASVGVDKIFFYGTDPVGTQATVDNQLVVVEYLN